MKRQPKMPGSSTLLLAQARFNNHWLALKYSPGLCSTKEWVPDIFS